MKIILTIIIILVCFSTILNAQGCSDAGACSIGDLRLSGKMGDEPPDLTVNYTQSLGLADKYSLVSLTSLRVKNRIMKTTFFEMMIPYQATFGNLGITSGVGDLFVSVSQTLYHLDDEKLSVVAGSRLKSNNSDKSIDGEPLPMVYQSSLGTEDLIAGINYNLKRWRFGLAYQHPFGANQNEYLTPVKSPRKSKSYFESAYLKRGDDLVLRLERIDEGESKNSYSYGLLGLYRLQEDQIKKDGEYVPVNQSDGLTMNVYFGWFRDVGRSRVFSLSGGFPLFARHFRPDGLTRTLIVNVGFTYKFKNKAKRMEPSGPLNKILDLEH